MSDDLNRAHERRAIHGGRASRALHSCVVIAASASMLLTALPGHTADIVTVNLTDAGPDRDLPVGSFYLAGTAKADTERVQPIIVRTTTPWLLGGGAPPNCTTVGQQLGLPHGSAQNLSSLPSGVTTSATFNAAAPKWAVLVPTPWERPAQLRASDGRSF